ncbi:MULTISPECIES: hypothetical protein [unclassified Vibrio]|nr:MULTISPECIES: hypothetical protein [unclassified Vibrio]
MHFTRKPNSQDIDILLSLPIYSLERLFERLPYQSKERLITAMLNKHLI